DLAFCRPIEADDLAQQHRFTRAGGPDNAENFAAAHIEIEAVVHGLLPKARDEAAHANGDVLAHQSISQNQSANKASIRMTMKMDCTTDVVTREPSEPTSPPTESPCLQPMMASTIAKNGVLIMPTQKCCAGTYSATRPKNMPGLMSSAPQHT